jgi:hypothetical protein
MVGLLLLTAIFLNPASARAQQGTVIRDEPTAYHPPMQQGAKQEPKGVMRVLSAICWYPVNRFVDFIDIPRFYFTAGDGMSGSVRATKYLNASWSNDSVGCLGWAGSARKPPFFTEQLNERYFGFLTAQQGLLERDPSEVGFSFHFIVVGLNASASLSEAADFVLGFIGIDLRADDHGPVLGWDLTPKPEPTPEAKPPKPSQPPMSGAPAAGSPGGQASGSAKPSTPVAPSAGSAKPAQESSH